MAILLLVIGFDRDHFSAFSSRPSSGIKYDGWFEIMNCADECDAILLCGDFNAYLPISGAASEDACGTELSAGVSGRDLIPLNASAPPFLLNTG